MSKFEEKMLIEYDDMLGQIVHIGEKYMTFKPLNSKAIILIYRQNWGSVAVMEVAQPS